MLVLVKAVQRCAWLKIEKQNSCEQEPYHVEATTPQFHAIVSFVVNCIM